MTAFHLAEVNIGRILGPMDSAVMADFVANLDEINALAESSAGFVWRLKTEDGNAVAVRPYEDDRIIVNLSVWESPETLHDYVYKTAHVEILRRRREWFSRMTEAFMTLWWVPVGHLPRVVEAVERLDHLRTHGSTSHAFTLRERFPAPDEDAGSRRESLDLSGGCPAL
ncbi:MAG: DUF3291 domain-containing protein [bacterium]